MTTFCTLLTCAVLPALNITPPVKIDAGYVSRYDQAPTDGTIEYRLSVGDIPDTWNEYDLMIAVLSCDHIGQEVTVSADGQLYSALVFDCAGDDGGYSWMVESNIVLELGWYSYQRYPELLYGYAEVWYE